MAKKAAPKAEPKKKLSPRDQAIAKIERALDRLRTQSGMEGTPWYNGMLRHYEGVLAELKAKRDSGS